MHIADVVLSFLVKGGARVTRVMNGLGGMLQFRMRERHLWLHFFCTNHGYRFQLYYLYHTLVASLVRLFDLALHEKRARQHEKAGKALVDLMDEVTRLHIDPRTKLSPLQGYLNLQLQSTTKVRRPSLYKPYLKHTRVICSRLRITIETQQQWTVHHRKFHLRVS
ncbi:hypothetical protein CC86DRAFT_69496 [Ophiobolus disseminans]|uniref:Uncharacterized protein n=1 Tax=Ophiobolus disseminans TaxID=1469910 RepID=A0A6A6ZRX3_9PLEO|nr:hypothetical protein CC86DRAFT_69496 [Ophiobolus disseminans]